MLDVSAIDNRIYAVSTRPLPYTRGESLGVGRELALVSVSSHKA